MLAPINRSRLVAAQNGDDHLSGGKYLPDDHLTEPEWLAAPAESVSPQPSLGHAVAPLADFAAPSVRLANGVLPGARKRVSVFGL